jgi:hypothetical protein
MMFVSRNGLRLIAVAAFLAIPFASANAGKCGYSDCAYAPPPYAEPVVYPQPPRYFVDQGPDFTGPNVTDFCLRPYDPGYINTFAYPYVGRYAGWRYRARPAMRVGYVSPSRAHHRIPSQFDWPLHR